MWVSSDAGLFFASLLRHQNSKNTTRGHSMKQSIIPTNFWDSAEMMALRCDPLSQTVAFYLLTSPRANVAGLYTFLS